MNRKRKYTIRGILMALLFCFGLMQGTMKVTAMGLEDIFDPEFYAQSNLDVADSMEPDRDILFRHFLSYGLAEGRSPELALNVAAYREAYPDLEEAFGNDWDSYVQHYVAIGIKEGRSNFALFSPIPYADANPDVKAAYGYDETALITHYLVFGIKEHRPLFPKVEKKQISGTGGGNGSHNSGTDHNSDHSGGDDSSRSSGGGSNQSSSDSGGGGTTKSITLSKSDTYPKLLAGNTTQIVADMEGYDTAATLLWQILTSGCAPGTTVDSNGLLSVDQAESNDQITVKAQDSNLPEISDTIDYEIFHIDKMIWNGVESSDEIWEWSGANKQVGENAIDTNLLSNTLKLYDEEEEIITDLSWSISTPADFEGNTYEETGQYAYEATVTCDEFEVPSTFTYTIEVTA
ncbi:MAG: hypothetical protein Q4B72_11720 [Lachnospiraceae bacterium]|nr:hypothetical protein [Lachnospiraceae bacterium]